MHTVIAALVEDASPDEALKTAKTDVFQPLVWRGTFDYFTTFDETAVTVSGRARYGDLTPVVPADSAVGQDWIEDRFETYTGEITRYAVKTDDYLRGLDGEYSGLWENREGERARFWMHQLGRFEGYPATVYGEDGEGVRSREYLEQVQETEEVLYVVLADVHW